MAHVNSASGRTITTMERSTGVLIVTGGSTGIGAATARLAAERGYAVCVNYLRRRDEAEAVAAGIRQDGAAALAVQADVGAEAEVLRMFARVDSELGRVTALVNNAATLETQMRLDAMD